MAFLQSFSSKAQSKGGGLPFRYKHVDTNLTRTQILSTEKTSIGETLVTAHISRIPISRLVATETAELLIRPLRVLVALGIHPRCIRIALKAVSDHPRSLSVVATDASGRCGLWRSRLLGRDLGGIRRIGWRHARAVTVVSKAHCISAATAAALTGAAFPQGDAVLLRTVGQPHRIARQGFVGERIRQAVLVVVGETAGRFRGTGSGERRGRDVRAPDFSHGRVFEHDAAVGIRFAQPGGRARLASGTVAPLDSRVRHRPVEGVSGVEPEHVHLNVIPEAENHGMSPIEGLAHAFHPSVFLVILHVAEKVLLGVAKLVGDGIAVLSRSKNG